MAVELVEARNQARTLTHLGMRCDSREIPFPLDEKQPHTHWTAFSLVFAMARRAAGEEDEQEFQTSRVPALVAAATTATMFYAIWAPQSGTAPAAWLASPLNRLQASPEGTAGLFRKRPRAISIEGPDAMLGLTQVSQADFARGRSYGGREAEFLNALRRGH